MKILVLDNEDTELKKRIIEYQNSYGNKAEITGVLVDGKWEKIKNRLKDINKYNYVFSDVHMPFPVDTYELFCEMRNDGIYAPIVLISSDCDNKEIPTEILGLNANKYENIIRQNVLPKTVDLKLLYPFTLPEEIPQKKIYIFRLIVLSILCQGYLAAHGKENFKVLDDKLQQKAEENKGQTELRSWWELVLNKYKMIKIELDSIDKNNGDFPLIDIIKNGKHKNISYFSEDSLIDDKIADFTNEVNSTYERLSEIIEGNF